MRGRGLGRTSLLLCELPENASRKFAYGSSMRVFPESTTHPGPMGKRSGFSPWKAIDLPVITTKRRMMILNMLRPCRQTP